MSSVITYDELEQADDVASFASDAVSRHMSSEVYRTAVSADNYFRQRNETIASFTAKLFSASGSVMEDFTASRLKLASNFFRRLNVQRCMYSLGKGVSFVNVDDDGRDSTKAALGPRFDDDIKRVGTLSLIHGVTFVFWNLDHVVIFPVTEFCPVWDANSGVLRAGVRFWRVDGSRPWHAVVYEEDGYTELSAEESGGLAFDVVKEKAAYKTTYQETPADGLRVAVGEENYSRLPIVPVWGSDAHQSTLVGMRESIDAYDLIKSGLANDVQDCAQVYWIVENSGGLTDADLERFRDRLKLTHIANADTDSGGAVRPYTQDVPYGARKETLQQIRADLYADFGALDVHTVAAGATNDHVDAAYQPMDEEADEFERHMREGIMDMLALQGVVDTPVFSRNRISNVKEQVEVVVMEAQWLDDETILRKLPNVTPDEVREILAKRDAQMLDETLAVG